MGVKTETGEGIYKLFQIVRPSKPIGSRIQKCPTRTIDVLFSTNLQVFAFKTILKLLWFPTMVKPGLTQTWRKLICFPASLAPTAFLRRTESNSAKNELKSDIFTLLCFHFHQLKSSSSLIPERLSL